MPFDFSRRPNRASEVSWYEWNEAFRQAASDDRPVFLCLTTPWCRWCQALDEGPLSDDVVIAALNRALVSTRVNVDERPDIALRYSMGGWPTVAFLTPEGEIITGATFLNAAELVAMIDNVVEAWTTQREDFAAEVGELRMAAAALLTAMREQPEQRDITPDFVSFLIDTALSAYDDEYGGFGRGAKFPRTDILETLLLAPGDDARSVLTHTLDAIVSGALHDRARGGFYRYAVNRDWSEPHTEKLAADNAALMQVLAAASQVLARPDWADVALATAHFLDDELWLPGDEAYAQALDAHEPGEDVPAASAPAYTAANAAVVRALSAVATACAAPRMEDRARALAERLWRRRSARGLLARWDEGPDCYLVDQAAMLEALLALWSRDAQDRWLEQARELWEAIDRYFSVSGNSVLLADVAAPADVPPASLAVYRQRVGRLGRTETPLTENARIAACLAQLGRAEDERALAERAQRMLQQLAPLAVGMGNYAIELARAALIASGSH